MRHAPAFWFQTGPSLWASLLSPFSWLVTGISNLQRAWRGRAPYHPGVPLISLGNLTVGGGGKTPLTQFLAGHFAANGWQVAIISRGYGGRATAHPTLVQPNRHTAWQVGDEPLAMAQALHHLPVQVWVGRNLPATVRRAEQAGATLLLLDDAFHRTDVAKTIDILVIHGANPWGNGRVLPAGPLREPAAHRTRANLAVVINPPPHAPQFYGLPAYRVLTLPTPESLAPLRGKRLLAFAGLAHPEKFFATLKQQGLDVVEQFAFADHAPYPPELQTALQERAHKRRAQLVTTSKDAVKLPPGFAHVLNLTFSGPELGNLLTDLQLRLQHPNHTASSRRQKQSRG